MDKRKRLATRIGAAFGLGAAARLGDLALIGGALATAAGAAGFAGYTALTNTHSPNVYGMQYLAIFAQPSHRAEIRAQAVGATLDLTPIGAIARTDKTSAGGYGLVGAKEGYAWLRDGDRIFAVRPGDDVPRLGRVARIALTARRWTLYGPGGAELLVSAQPTLSPSEAPFGKRMIFDAP